MTTHRRRSNRDRTFPTGLGIAANAFSRNDLLKARAVALVHGWREAWYHLLRIQLLSLAVPLGTDIMAASSMVRVVRRSVIVHRKMRDITVRRILTHGWHLAVTTIPKGSRSDDFCIIEGWEWIYPELPGSPVEPSLGLIRDVTMLRSMSGGGQSEAFGNDYGGISE